MCAALIAGIDFSSKAIHAALIPLDPDDGSDAPPVTLRCYRMPTEKQMRGSMDKTTPACRSVERCRVMRGAMRYLLDWIQRPGDDGYNTHAFEVVHVCVEEPFGASRKADNVMRELYGAILASIPPHIERDTITTQEWRRIIWPAGSEGRLAVAQGEWKGFAINMAEAHAGQRMDEHSAEAFLIARACRARLDKAFAA